MTDNTITIMSVSGGKDSTAMLLWALERKTPFRPVFANTGNEHPATLDYVRNLPRLTGCPEIEWIKADFSDAFEGRRKRLPGLWMPDLLQGRPGMPPMSQEEAKKCVQTAQEAMHPTGNPFLDLCLLKARFPSTRARFCSQSLKRDAIHEQVIIPLLDEGFQVVSMLGVRRDESRARAALEEWEDLGDGRMIHRPIVGWSAAQVFDIHRRHGVEPNPLYKQGCTRVGCMPCIHERKAGILNISQRWPEHLERIADWEQRVKRASKRQWATFFPADKTPGPHRHDVTLPIPTVWEVVEWSKTGRGGYNYDMFADEAPPACASEYGLCE
ncbi:MAG: phosphoadenosine phosphosulfate reductase family protein [Magnetococcales bacterium]|nr:phosphoadenosine phosphosulfate reductase family protein [Magnetococcales bacterium]